MGIFLIDFENVHDNGLEGIKNLTQNDKVIIFYSEKIKSMPFSRHIEMMNCKAKIEYIETHKTGKNYLDFQLATHLGFLIGKGETRPVYIISKDTGFESIIDYWREQKIAIVRQENISGINEKEEIRDQNREKKKIEKKKQEKGKLSEDYRKKIRKAVKDDGLTGGNYKAIYSAIICSKDNSVLHNSLVKMLNKEKGGIVYNHVKTIFAEYHKNNTETVNDI